MQVHDGSWVGLYLVGRHETCSGVPMFQTPSSSAQIAAEAHKNEQGMALFSELARLMLVVFFYAPFTAPNMQLGDVGPHRSIRLTPSALLRRMRSPSPPH